MKCFICYSNTEYYFTKIYDKEPEKSIMEAMGKADFYKCINCGFTFSKTYQELTEEQFTSLNYKAHSYHENIENIGNQPPYLEQATMFAVLAKNKIIDASTLIDFAGGYGAMSRTLQKYFSIDLPVYEPYIQTDGFLNYISTQDLSSYKTVINSAMFEHVRSRDNLEVVNSLVDTSGGGGSLVVHTVVCENIPQDPSWFYLVPMHCALHTNMSMSILMEQWGYKASIYCLSAKSWVLLRSIEGVKRKVEEINKELQTEYLIYKKGFVDYWKCF